MSTVATLWVKLGLDGKGYSQGLKNAADKTKDVGKSIMGIGAGITAGITLPIVGAGVAIVNMASDLEESQNAVNVVFGESSKIIKDYGETVATTAGLNNAEFSQMSAVTGAFLKNVGFNEEEAANKTIELTERAADMASIFNTDVNQALAAIQSGLKGEFNPLEQFGVKMNANMIAAKALSMGLVGTTQDLLKVREAEIKATEAQRKYNDTLVKYGDESEEARKAGLAHAKAQQNLEKALAGNTDEITDAMKAQAAMALVMEQTEQFAGDFVNTSDGLANSTKIMTAQFTDAAAALGSNLLPIGLKIVQFLTDLVSKFSALNPEQQKTILAVLGIVAAIGPLVTIVGGLISVWGALSGAFVAFAGFIGVAVGPLLLAIAAVVAIIAALKYAWDNNLGGIQDKVKDFIAKVTPVWNAFWAGIKEKVKGAIEFIKMIISTFQSALAGDWELFGQKLRALWEIAWGAIKATISNAWISIKAKAKEIIDNIKNFFENADWGEIGKNIVEGIGNGLASMAGWIWTKAQDIARAIKDAVDGFFANGSPSKLMMKTSGPDIANGVIKGFERTVSSFNPNMAFAGVGSASVATPAGNGISASDLQGMQSEPMNYPKLARSMRDAFLKETQ